MTDSAFSNFDLNLSKKLLSMLREGYPARLKRVYVVTPPLWFKAMYKVLTPLLKEKIKERVRIVVTDFELKIYIQRVPINIVHGEIADYLISQSD